MTDWERLERDDAVATARLLRRALRVVTALCLVGVVLPFLVRSVDWLGFVGLVCVVLLSMIAPWWVFPVALSPRRGVVRDGDLVSVVTVRGDRTIDLRQVDRVRTRTLWAEAGNGVFGLVTGPGQPAVVVSWSQYDDAATSSAVAVVQDAAGRAGVLVTDRARRDVRLDDPGTPATRAGDGAARLATFLLALVWVIVPLGTYVLLLTTLPGR